MATGALYLAGPEHQSFGRIEVERAEGELRVGQFIPTDWPDELRALFERYDELVNDQVFAALDELEEQIDALRLCVLDDDTGQRTPVSDVQLTRDNRISFRIKS